MTDIGYELSFFILKKGLDDIKRVRVYKKYWLHLKASAHI